jgi:hypothetical protein
MYIISMNRSRNRKDVYYLNQIWRRLLDSEGPSQGIDKNTIVYAETNDKTKHCKVPRDDVHYVGIIPVVLERVLSQPQAAIPNFEPSTRRLF